MEGNLALFEGRGKVTKGRRISKMNTNSNEETRNYYGSLYPHENRRY